MHKQKNNFYYNIITKDYDKDFYDTMLYLVNSMLFDYGSHFKSSSLSRINQFKKKTKVFLLQIYLLVLSFRNKRIESKGIILSNAYIPLLFEDRETYLPPWSFSFAQPSLSNSKLNRVILELNKIIEQRSIKSLFSYRFKLLVEEFKVELTALMKLNNVKSLVVPNDMSFYENLSIKIAKKSNIPTFVYLHGLPARYNSLDDNRADYLIVWGKGLKNAYVKAGFLSDKILTIKHPFYSDFENTSLRSSFEDVLVITKAISGAPTTSDELYLNNRSKPLFYLEKVKELLQLSGVTSARLRLHPSEEKEFYITNLTDDFFIIDNKDKISSLSQASLVVGPTSTMVLDAIKMGVNYILYDPFFGGLLLDDSKELVSPFDGSSFIKLSLHLEDFTSNIKNPSDNINYEKLSEYLKVDDNDSKIILKIITE